MGLFLGALILGIVLASPSSEASWPPLSLVTTIVLSVVASRRRWRKSTLALLIAGGVAGLAASGWEGLRAPASGAAVPEGAATSLSGVLLDRVERSDSVQLLLGGVKWGPDRTPLDGLLRLASYRPLTALPGDRVTLRARLKIPGGYRVPGAFDYGAWLRHRGVAATGYVTAVGEITPGVGWALFNRLRSRIGQWIAATLPPRQAALAEALLVGKRGRLDGALREHFMVAGLFHLVAISGLHMGLVAGGAFYLIRLLLALCLPLSRRMDVKRPAAWLAFIPMLLYGGLAGWSLSTQRAAIMVGAFLLAAALGRFSSAWRALGAAAVLILLWRPHQLFEAGFQLSFLSVAALLGAIPAWRGPGRWAWLRGLAATNVGLGLLIAPVAAHHFHMLSPYGPLANLVAIPLVSFLILPLGLAALLFWPLSATVSGALLGWMGALLGLLADWAGWIAALPGAWARHPGPTLAGLAVMVACLAGVVALRSTRWRLALGLAAIAGLFLPHPQPPEERLFAAVLDVGQAQAVVVHAPEGGWSVLDVGGFSGPRFDTGEAVVSAFLWRYGVERLERVAISHPQSDHMAGARAVLRNFEVGALWLGPFAEAEREREDYRRLLETARAREVPIRRFRTGGVVEDGRARFRVLPSYPGGAGNPNLRSLVVEVGLDQTRLLVPGDVEVEAERWLVAGEAVGPVSAVVAPHHGSRSSSAVELVEALRPPHLLISVGRNNRYRFPHPEVIDRWRDVGADVWRTDRDGTLFLESDGVTVTVGSLLRSAE